MRILFTSHSPLTSGGAEQCLLEYVDVLQKHGHTCWVAVPGRGAMTEKLNANKINHKVLPLSWAIQPRDSQGALVGSGESFIELYKYAQAVKPDIIVVNTVVVPWGLYVGKTLGIPTLLLAHEIINDKQQALAIAPNYEVYTQNLNRNTDYIIYNSQFVKNEFAKDFTLPKTSQGILYPSPNIDSQLIQRTLKNNVIEDTITIGIFGSLSPRKNQTEALEAACILKKDGVRFRIDLYGDMNDIGYVTSLKKFINQNKLDDYVKLCGFSENVYATMNTYNIVLSTSINEPFGRTLLEGQLFERLVITNNTGGGLELVEHMKTGLVYKLGSPDELAEAIRWTTLHKEEAVKIGQNARIEQYAKYIKGDKYKPLIEAVNYLSKKKPPMTDMFDPLLGLAMYATRPRKRNNVLRKLYRNRVTRYLAHRFTFIKKAHNFIVRQ